MNVKHLKVHQMPCDYIFTKGPRKNMMCGVNPRKSREKCSMHFSRDLRVEQVSVIDHDKRCGICYEDCDTTSKHPCKQCTFQCCSGCFDQLVKPSCPICRVENFKNIRYVEIMNIIREIIQSGQYREVGQEIMIDSVLFEEEDLNLVEMIFANFDIYI